MSDFFIQQWGWFEITMVAMLIFVIAILTFGAIPQGIEQAELNKEQREVIKELDCRELGELILSDDLRRANQPFADKHWHIRCE